MYSGALRGLGNTRFPLVANAGGIWMAVAVAYLLVRAFEASPPVAWAGFLVSAPLGAGLVWWRFRRAAAAHIQADRAADSPDHAEALPFPVPAHGPR